MKAHDLRAILASISDEEATLARGDPSRIFDEFNQCVVSAVRFSARSPWERHPAGDELLNVLEGEIELSVLAPEGHVQITLRAGSVFIVPRGLWHRSCPRGTASMFGVTPTNGSEHSWADDPRG
jgi:quercetin dioxygenase-like cupin family protein